MILNLCFLKQYCNCLKFAFEAEKIWKTNFYIVVHFSALVLNIALWCLYLAILCLLGLVIYASFHDCDPLKAGIISQPDQVCELPHYQNLIIKCDNHHFVKKRCACMKWFLSAFTWGWIYGLSQNLLTFIIVLYHKPNCLPKKQKNNHISHTRKKRKLHRIVLVF